ncbi:hypothetical protein Asppvi_004459 [Aspergillus pseudoviridinutans]|uniref:Uncharacterized protein n=1 Tax=Aspergillus pseudoviridinutans TaxID=1517512 RepID=A0A9P3EUB0_9EURO|nr:uncharacterized protein Asppvi_004459 [Aspergillus pseudoviridinutans]GIJ85600.1 hypothetical protein Asppvi_004459 [Aspergillus pseudoviridinutans]
MANLFPSLFQKLFGNSSIPPPTHINLAVTVSSTTLHKHGSGSESHLILEATLPQSPNTPDKPLTILIFDTLLDPSGIALYKDGLDFIDVGTGAPANRTSLIFHYEFGGRSNIPVEPQSERYFATLYPGVPYRVTFTLKPCPRIQPHAEGTPERLENSCGERVPTARDEDIVASVFSHVTYLDVGSMYRVELGNKLNKIWWYRYGSKEEILGGQGTEGGLVGKLMGTKRRRELVEDSLMQPIPLVMQGSARFTVVE